MADIDLTIVVLIVLVTVVLLFAFVIHDRWHIKPRMKSRHDALDRTVAIERLNRDN